MGKKFGLDKQYSSLLTNVNKNSPSGILGKAYKSKLNVLKGASEARRIELLNKPSFNITVYDQKSYEAAGGKGKANLKDYKSLGVKNEDQYFKIKNTVKKAVKSSKLLNVGKKVFSKTPIGRAVNLAVNVGSGIGIGYSYAKNKFNKKKADFQKGDYSDIKTDKKSAGGEMNQMNIKGYMGGGASRGYGAARTSGMGLQDESLKPGKMVRASKGKMAKMNRGGGMDAGAAQNKADFRAKVIKYAQKNKGQDRLTQSDIKMAEKTLTAMNKLKK